MTVYSAGTGPLQLQTPLQAGISFSTAQVDTAWVTNSLAIADVTSFASLAPWDPITEGWVHFELYTSGVSFFRDMIYLKDDTGRTVFTINENEQCFFWNGSTNFYFGFFSPPSGRMQWDIYFKIDAVEGEVAVYIGRELVASFEGDTSGMSNIVTAHLFNPIRFSGSNYYSQILVADFPTLFAKVKQTLFTTDGTYTGWTGTVLDIKDGIPNENTFIKTNVPAKESFKAAARDFTGYAIQAVSISYSGQRGGAGAPNNARAFVRIGGVDYNLETKALKYGRNNFPTVMNLNPATGLVWTAAEAGDATMEVGIEALVI